MTTIRIVKDQKKIYIKKTDKSISIVQKKNLIKVEQVQSTIKVNAKSKRGLTGPQGDSATVEVGTVTTGAPGTPVVITNTGTDNDAVLNFTIPEGQKGDGSTTSWGGILGDIENQTDLQAELADKYDVSNPANYINASQAPVQSVQGRTGAVIINKTDVGLSNVPNLDTTTAVADAHTHANKAILDATTASFTTAKDTKLAGIEANAQVNNISNVNATDLTDGGDSTLHYHASDRNRANHTGSQAISTVTNLQTTLDGKEAAFSKGNIVAGANVTISGTLTSRLVGAGDITINSSGGGGGGGGGAVASVNGQTGVVVLDTDDVDDTATNRYTNDTDITRLANTSGTNTGDQDLSGYATTASLSNYVPNTRTVNGKALSSNISITQSDVGLSNVNNTSDANKPISTATQTALNLKANSADLATVATTGDYNDLSNKPTIPSAYTDEQAQDAVGGILTDTSTLDFTYSDATPSITAAVLDSPLLNGQAGTYYRARSNHTGTQTASTISDFNSVASAAAPVQSVASKTGAVTLVKGDVGLGNVDNTADASKSVSSAATLTTPRTIGVQTGDVTSAGSSFNGSATNTNVTTLATVNSNVGSFTNANITVNAKGLITAASNGSGGGTTVNYYQTTDVQEFTYAGSNAFTISQPIGKVINVEVNGKGSDGVEFSNVGSIVTVTPTTHTFVTGEIIRIEFTTAATYSSTAGLSLGIVTKTSAYSIAGNDYTVLCNTTSAGFTVTLPTAVGKTGQIYNIKKISTDTNTLTIATTSSQTIDTAANITTMATVRPSYTLQSDGANWWVI